jgi:hypothetical protein
MGRDMRERREGDKNKKERMIDEDTNYAIYPGN